MDLFTHFWLICGAWVGVGGALMSYIMLAKPLAAGDITAQERARWSTGSALVVITPSLMLWALGLTVTDPSFHPLDWPSPQRYLGVGVLVGVWGLALWWVLVRSGASVLSRMLPHISFGVPRSFLTESAVKVWTVLFVLSGVFSLLAFDGARQ